MTQPIAPDYATLSLAFSTHELMASATEAHGVLCGLICGGIALDDKSWRQPFNDLINDGSAPPAALKPLLEQTYQRIVADLVAQKGVSVLLPNDDAPLDERLDAFVDWSQAFLAGFGVAAQELSHASEDLQEMIHDIASITQVAAEFDQEDSENEAAFWVLYEHVRLGAMMAFEEFAKTPPREHPHSVLH
ncbi:MAG: UPF0149 family protein [Aeromonas sp.]